MKLEELSDKEIAILELLDNKNYIGVRAIAKKTGYSCSEVFKVTGDRNLLREFRRMKEGKEKEEIKKIVLKEIKKRVRLMPEKQKKIKERKKEKENLILEAICNKGCRTMTAISKITGIHNTSIWRICNNANLLPDLKEMKKQDDYELVKKNYEPSIGIGELVEKTGLYRNRVEAVLKKVKENYGRETPLSFAQKDLATILNQVVLKRAEKENPAFYYAFNYSRKSISKLKLGFDEIYKRFKDIFQGYTFTECKKRWGMNSHQAVDGFIRYVGLRELHRQKRQKKKDL